MYIYVYMRMKSSKTSSSAARTPSSRLLGAAQRSPAPPTSGVSDAAVREARKGGNGCEAPPYYLAINQKDATNRIKFL